MHASHQRRIGWPACGLVFADLPKAPHAPVHEAGAQIGVEQEDAILNILGPGPLEAVTSHTKTDPLEILKDIREVRRKGYAISDEEYVDGVLTIGAAIRDRAGLAIAGLRRKRQA